MEHPFYQPPMPRPPADGPAPAHRSSRFLRRVIRAVLCPRYLLARRGGGRRGHGHPGRDVLWRAKCNALHRALADHDLSTHQARAILCRLSATRGRGCELARLGSLTGIDAGVLDRAVPLLGLQNFISVRETRPEGCSGPAVLWISATEHGLRYASEVFASFSGGPRDPAPEETA